MKRIVVLSAVLTLVLLIFTPISADMFKEMISPGDYFPSYTFRADLASAETAYLGVAENAVGKREFQVNDIWGDVLVLELFNRFCFGCQQGAPTMNKAYEMVASDPFLSTRVRFVGLGIGNNKRTVADFKREFEVAFPLLPDPRFTIMEALGNPGGTPYTIILRKTSKGPIVVNNHFGTYDSPEELVGQIKEALSEDIDTIIANAEPSSLAPWLKKELVPPLSGDELWNRVEKSMERGGYGKVGLFTVKLPSGEKVYVGESSQGKVFSRVVSRLPICDVCHPVHFILTVNSRGAVVDFDAIYVTKYWNKPWTVEEVKQMRKRLMGMSIFDNTLFDPEVDAVSTATMSSSLIFDSLTRSGRVMEMLEESGKF